MARRNPLRTTRPARSASIPGQNLAPPFGHCTRPIGLHFVDQATNSDSKGFDRSGPARCPVSILLMRRTSGSHVGCWVLRLRVETRRGRGGSGKLFYPFFRVAVGGAPCGGTRQHCRLATHRRRPTSRDEQPQQNNRTKSGIQDLPHRFGTSGLSRGV